MTSVPSVDVYTITLKWEYKLYYFSSIICKTSNVMGIRLIGNIRKGAMQRIASLNLS